MADLKIGDTVNLVVAPKFIPDQYFWEGFNVAIEMSFILLNNFEGGNYTLARELELMVMEFKKRGLK